MILLPVIVLLISHTGTLRCMQHSQQLLLENTEEVFLLLDKEIFTSCILHARNKAHNYCANEEMNQEKDNNNNYQA